MDARRPSLLAVALLAPVALAVVPAPAGAQIPQIAPDVAGLTIQPPRFRAAPSGNPVVTSGGALVSFTLDSGANVDFTVRALATGRRANGRCVKGRARTRRARCTITTAVPGQFTLIGIPGPNEIRFSGRIGDRTLKPGAYRLVAKAQGQAARSAFAPFTVLPVR